MRSRYKSFFPGNHEGLSQVGSDENGQSEIRTDRSSKERADCDSAIREQGRAIAEKPLFSHTIIFNKSGQVIEQLNQNLDGSEWRSVNDYTDSGNLLATRSFDPTGALNSEVRYIYDDNDRLTAEQHVDL